MKLPVRHIPWYLSWKGLIGKKQETVMFQTHFGIHTCFMRYPIDVVILDKNNRVRKVKTNLQPWRFFFWNPFFDTVVEMPGGTIQKHSLTRGTVVEFKKTQKPYSLTVGLMS